MIKIDIKRFGGRGATSSRSVYGTITESEHDNLIRQSKSAWGEAIENQKGYVRTGLSFEINRKLRNLPDGVDARDENLGTASHWTTGEVDVNKVIQNMDMLTSKPIIGNGKNGRNMVLTRFVDEGWASNVLGTNSLSQLTGLDWKGTEITEKGFMSTSSIASNNVFTGRPIKMEIETSKKTRGFVANNREESEIVLPRNSKFRITGTSRDSNGNYVVRMKVIDTPDNSRGGFAGNPSVR